MTPFPKAIAEVQRVSLARELVEAYDGLESTLAQITALGSAGHLVNLTDDDLSEIKRRVNAAKDAIFQARTIAEKGQP